MANPYINQGGEMDTPEMTQIMRRQQLAQQLLNQGQESPQGQMVSGHYVAPSLTQYLAQGLKTYMGAKGMRESEQEAQDYAKEQKAKKEDQLRQISDLLVGRKAAYSLPEGQQGPQVTEIKPDVTQAYQVAAHLDNPALQQWGLQGTVAHAEKQSQLQEQEALRKRYSDVWTASGGDPKKALAAGLPYEVVKQFAETPNLGKEKLINVNGQLVGEYSGEKFGDVIPKQYDKPASLQEYEYAVKQGYKGTYDQFDREQRRSGASTINQNVSTGQKGLDNTLKLRSDFRSEPVYKAHQEMQSAYSQIKAGLTAGTPVGDLAAATKIMKLLDPGSVVRESELGMAMAATGLLDRLENYATNVVSGNKLNDKQRKEFQALSDALYGESVKQYTSKAGEYAEIAERNGLRKNDVVGNLPTVPLTSKPITVAPKTSGANTKGFSIRPIP